MCYNVLMVKVEIEVPRPWLLSGLCAAFIAGVLWAGGGENAVGGLGMRAQLVVHEAEDEARILRIQQAVLVHQEEILRYELQLLTAQHEAAADDPIIERQYWEARQSLVALLQDKRGAEERLLETIRQMWEAQGGGITASVGASGTIPMVWPVSPDEGLSATFGDLKYRERFHLEHLAIDIPKLPRSTVVAAADGVVIGVSDQGMGFNALTIRHRGGIVTQYGHVLEFLVREDEEVHAGDPVALSGGLPGTPGAGWLTTGPHLHFAVFSDGQPVDPMKFLPALPEI